MTWVKLDDQFFTHPKTLAAGKDGTLLYLAGLCWTKQHLTDGLIPKTALRVLAAQVSVDGSRTARRLIASRLWHDEDSHWRINGFHDYQESATVERDRKAEHAAKMRKWREEKQKERAKEKNDRDASRDASRDGPVTPPYTYTDTDTDTDTDKSVVVVVEDFLRSAGQR